MFVPEPPFLCKVICTWNFMPRSTLEVGDIVMIDVKDYSTCRGWMVAPDEYGIEWGVLGKHYELYEEEA